MGDCRKRHRRHSAEPEPIFVVSARWATINYRKERIVRGLMNVAVAAALLGSGYGTTGVTRVVDDEAERDCAKSREAEEIERRKRLERHRARDDERQRDRAAVIAREQMLSVGLDPTNGNPMSRQQRRWIARKGYHA